MNLLPKTQPTGTRPPDKRCSDCLMPRRFCMCQMVEPRSSLWQCHLIMSRGESQRVSNTGKLLKLILKDTKIHIRGDKHKPLNYKELICPSRTTLLLFPCEKAKTISELGLGPQDPVQLLIPDGNWPQAAKISNKLLSYPGVIPVKVPTVPSQYRLRSNPNPGRISTFESLRELMKEAGHQELLEPMEKVFEGMITRVLCLRGKIKKEEVTSLS